MARLSGEASTAKGSVADFEAAAAEIAGGLLSQIAALCRSSESQASTVDIPSIGPLSSPAMVANRTI